MVCVLVYITAAPTNHTNTTTAVYTEDTKDYQYHQPLYYLINPFDMLDNTG